jgi:hypothetical protein
MSKTSLSVVILAGCLLTTGATEAQTQRYACSLLTAAEVGTFAGAAVGTPMSHDEVLARGPFQGERLQRCNWPLGDGGRAGNVYVNVTPTGAQGTGKASALLDDMASQLKAQKWSVEAINVAGTNCVIATSPAAQKAAAVSCVTEAKGKAISLASVGTGPKPAADKLKALLDKAVARLP